MGIQVRKVASDICNCCGKALTPITEIQAGEKSIFVCESCLTDVHNAIGEETIVGLAVGELTREKMQIKVAIDVVFGEDSK